jgi:hypothetical protein
MAKGKTEDQDQNQQTIEELSKRYQDLNTRKIQAEKNLKTAQKQLEELRKRAKKDHGTDDLDELKKKLNTLKAGNEAKRAAYQQSLDKIETDLAAVEAKHGSPDGSEEKGD